MPSSSDYLEYVLELLEKCEDISYRKMMGEYLLYSNGILFGGIYDNRFLIKKTDTLSVFDLQEAIPYDGAKTMLSVDSEDKDKICIIVNTALSDLGKTKKKK